jgi:hypothetical protein
MLKLADATLVDNALPKVTVIPAVFITIELVKVTPFVVKVHVPEILKAPVFDHVVVADNVMLPATVKLPVLVSVQVAPVVVRLRQFKVPVNVITGDPEDPSIKTSSVAVGAVAPAAPPEVAAQCVVVVSQVPVPPTQYLDAIKNPYACVATATTSQNTSVEL